jgi:YVTN family beta-propeller protein
MPRAQRLLASATLPPGRYAGISLEIKQAFLRGEEGEGSLLVSEEPFSLVQPFTVRRKRALALFLSLDPAKAVSEGFRFTPAFSLATSERELIGLTGYVSDSARHTLFVFDKKRMQVTSVIATGGGPRGIALDPVRRRVYVALSGSDALVAIDVLSGESIGRVSLNPGDGPEDLALTPDGQFLVCVNYVSGTASIIDAERLFELGRVRVGERPTGVAMSPSGQRAFVVNSVSATVSVVDIARRRILATLSIDGTPSKAAIAREGERLFVISEDSPNLLVVDPASLTVTRRVFVGSGAVAIKVDMQSGLIYLAKRLEGQITVIEPSSLIVIDEFDIGGAASHLTIDGDENALIAVLPEEGKLVKASIVKQKVVSEMEIGGGSYSVVVVGER